MTRQSAVDVAAMLGAPVILAALVAGLFFYTQGIIQSALDERERQYLADVFPAATRFSDTTSDPPHVKAFGKPTGSGEEALLGFVFSTREVEPLERGYDGPINILVGMTVAGSLTGIKVIEHQEPYGYFSLETDGFRRQFTGKHIGEPFVVGRDVDAISRATITVSSAARAIRNSIRQIARHYLTE